MNAALPLSLPGQLFQRAEQHPHAVAIREKRLGIWNELSFQGYLERVGWAARMLWELGVRAGDSVAIISDNRPEWLFADLGTQALGARSVGIYQTNPPSDVAYILNDAQCRVVLCEDQEQYDKVATVAAETPSVQHILVVEPRGLRGVEDARLRTWERFLEEGRALLEREPGWLREQLARRTPDEGAMVIYTSGTTGAPKGALISSRNMLEGSATFTAQLGLGQDDSVVSYLPLCHVAEKLFSLLLPLVVGGKVHFGEALETVQHDVAEVSPTVFLGVPRIWEKMHASVTVKMRDASWLKRTLFNTFTRLGAGIRERERTGQRRWWDALVWRVGDLLVYRPLQERLGLRRCRFPISGAAPISPELLAWYDSIGVRIYEGYAQTEGSGSSHLNVPGATRLGTVGRAVPGVECRLAEDGEVLVRGTNVFLGYLNKPEATAEVLDSEGWLHTGDLGDIDADGYLRITGRKREILITSGGKNLSPERIQNALKNSPYIKEAVAIGDRRAFVTALVQVDPETVADWALRRKIAFTSYTDLTLRPEVRKLIEEEVARANEGLARVEQVRTFRLLAREMTQDAGEVTASLKVRRKAVLELHSALVEEMYARTRE
ncbi:AMP-binding protein [Myxococcus sp. CA056]|uniref:AMP-dependent synthetase/ligase n=1 Tax=unclassified Myxococcus TaxID=2648731 RepID=UPI00157B66CD|nr:MULTISPECIES: AMP-binding protein [unclassified Myxococcus]NTX10071.1 AMP-binding protein [Myxococcus sp. CA056]NTX53025.1 AMP-binding protein [Myxococcus sp. CA039A]